MDLRASHRHRRTRREYLTPQAVRFNVMETARIPRAVSAHYQEVPSKRSGDWTGADDAPVAPAEGAKAVLRARGILPER